jgi:NitT/TauT family transport system substrate-binding protein
MRRSLSGLLGAVAALLVACGGQAGAPPASAPASLAASTSARPPASAPASAAGLTPLHVASAAVSADGIAVYVAKEAGIFEKNGLDIDVGAISGASTTISALLAGDVQLLNAGAGEALSAIAAGTDLVFVGLLAPVYTYQLEVPAAVKAPADLKGKTLGVAALGATVDIATRVGLRKIDLKPETDVKIAALGSLPATTAAILNGTVDGGMMNLPASLAAEDKGHHSLLNMAAAKLPAASSAVYLQRSYAAAHRDVVQKYVDSLVEATARLKGDKPFTLGVYRKYLKLDDERGLNAVYDFYSKDVIPDLPYARPENFQDAISILSAQNPKVGSLDVGKSIDSSYVADAEKRGLNKP